MKILISDFDRTLFDDNYHNNIKKVNEFVSNGNLFVIATGRCLFELRKEIDNVKINFNYLICNDGGSIYDSNYNLINEILLDPNIVKDIFELLNNSGLIENCLIASENEYTLDFNEKAYSLVGTFSDYSKTKELLEKIISSYSVAGYLSDDWINIKNASINKAKGIEYLMNYFDLNDDIIYTIGDQVNDIEMVEKYNGYAVNSAVDDLKKVSKRTVESVEELVNLIENKKDF